MTSKPSRVILAFYSAGDGDPKSAYEDARRAGASAVLINDPSSSEKFAALRLESETLIVASCGTLDAEPVAKALESHGSPAIFILREPSPLADLRKGSIVDRLRVNQIALDEVRRNLTEAARMDRALTASAEWLLDNSYLIRTQISEVRRHLPRNFPKTSSGNSFATCPESRGQSGYTDRSFGE